MNIVTPATLEELSHTLKQATAQQQRVTVRGGNTTHLTSAVDVCLDLARLNRVIEYEPANLTITVEAGMTLAALQATLREQGQFLPIDPPQAERATIGGVLASNAHGPWRLRYGTLRDWTIGMRVVLADGNLVRGGGKVVKNVAGYDMPKLFIGSHGTLGVIVEATFKLAPLPAHTRTLVAQFASHTTATKMMPALLRFMPSLDAAEILDPAAAQAVIASETSVAVQSPFRLREIASQTTLAMTPHHLLVAQFTGNEPTIARQARDFETLCKQHEANEVTTLEESLAQRVWQAVRDLPATLGDETTTLLELRLLPSQLDEAVALMRTLADERNTRAMMFARAGQALWAALQGDDAKVIELVNRLREWATNRKGFLVVQRVPPTLRGKLDVWGVPRPEVAVMRRLKEQFDPRNVLQADDWLFT
jgi:glycolate oxidase FAD binding subunit